MGLYQRQQLFRELLSVRKPRQGQLIADSEGINGRREMEDLEILAIEFRCGAGREDALGLSVHADLLTHEDETRPAALQGLDKQLHKECDDTGQLRRKLVCVGEVQN